MRKIPFVTLDKAREIAEVIPTPSTSMTRRASVSGPVT